MKKLIALLLAGCMMASMVVGCGSKEEAAEAPAATEEAAEAEDTADAESDLAYVKEKGVLVVGITDFAPMDYKNEDGEWEAVYLDAKYYYQFFHGMDYTYDIYAEWPLEADKFGEEVQRVKGVFEKAIADKTYGYKFVEIEKGEYTCLILYSGDEPFQKATNNYQYLIFAYSETTNSVRYIYCDSLENGVDQPYYLQLDW